jgi:NAD dependent epimerase/dehydratase family enzyme
MLHLIDSDHAGPFNVSAPEPVRQSEFADTLASVLRRPAVIPAPSFAMKVVLGPEKAGSIGLSSTRALPQRLLTTGYEFAETSLERSLLRAVRSRPEVDEPVATS